MWLRSCLLCFTFFFLRTKKNIHYPVNVFFFYGAPDRARTYNRLNRNQVLYPIELQAHLPIHYTTKSVEFHFCFMVYWEKKIFKRRIYGQKNYTS